MNPQPIQDEDVLDNPTGQRGAGGTSNVDVSIYFANTCDFQALIKELKNQSRTVTQRLEARMA